MDIAKIRQAIQLLNDCLTPLDPVFVVYYDYLGADQRITFIGSTRDACEDYIFDYRLEAIQYNKIVRVSELRDIYGLSDIGLTIRSKRGAKNYKLLKKYVGEKGIKIVKGRIDYVSFLTCTDDQLHSFICELEPNSMPFGIQEVKLNCPLIE